LLIREEGDVQGPPAEHESDGQCEKSSSMYNKAIVISNWNNKRGGRLQQNDVEAGQGRVGI
jgi:hypothetical protein